jgi:hypothetical protein
METVQGNPFVQLICANKNKKNAVILGTHMPGEMPVPLRELEKRDQPSLYP